MAKVAVIIDDMFEDVEYTEPVAALRGEGHETVNVGIKSEGSVVKGKKLGTEVKIDRKVSDVSGNDFDALLIPGGYSPDHLRADKDAIRFTQEMMEARKPIFSICHAPQLLISAELIYGKKITGWKSVIQDIKNAGAEFVDAPVVIDGNLISSRGPRDLPRFNDAIKDKLRSMVSA